MSVRRHACPGRRRTTRSLYAWAALRTADQGACSGDVDGRALARHGVGLAHRRDHPCIAADGRTTRSTGAEPCPPAADHHVHRAPWWCVDPVGGRGRGDRGQRGVGLLSTDRMRTLVSDARVRTRRDRHRGDRTGAPIPRGCRGPAHVELVCCGDRDLVHADDHPIDIAPPAARRPAPPRARPSAHLPNNLARRSCLRPGTSRRRWRC